MENFLPDTELDQLSTLNTIDDDFSSKRSPNFSSRHRWAIFRLVKIYLILKGDAQEKLCQKLAKRDWQKIFEMRSKDQNDSSRDLKQIKKCYFNINSLRDDNIKNNASILDDIVYMFARLFSKNTHDNDKFISDLILNPNKDSNFSELKDKIGLIKYKGRAIYDSETFFKELNENTLEIIEAVKIYSKSNKKEKFNKKRNLKEIKCATFKVKKVSKSNKKSSFEKIKLDGDLQIEKSIETQTKIFSQFKSVQSSNEIAKSLDLSQKSQCIEEISSNPQMVTTTFCNIDENKNNYNQIFSPKTIFEAQISSNLNDTNHGYQVAQPSVKQENNSHFDYTLNQNLIPVDQNQRATLYCEKDFSNEYHKNCQTSQYAFVNNNQPTAYYSISILDGNDLKIIYVPSSQNFIEGNSNINYSKDIILLCKNYQS